MLFIVLLATALLVASIVCAVTGAWLPAIYFALLWIGVNVNTGIMMGN